MAKHYLTRSCHKFTLSAQKINVWPYRRLLCSLRTSQVDSNALNCPEKVVGRWENLGRIAKINSRSESAGAIFLYLGVFVHSPVLLMVHLVSSVRILCQNRFSGSPALARKTQSPSVSPNSASVSRCSAHSNFDLGVAPLSLSPAPPLANFSSAFKSRFGSFRVVWLYVSKGWPLVWWYGEVKATLRIGFRGASDFTKKFDLYL